MTEQYPLQLYNSLTRTKQRFKPQDSKRVTMYNCGPTVYSYAHIGNARAAVVADVLFRVLRHIYGEDHVVYARNLTDVDDRIIQSAKETGKPISEITEKYARIYNEDLAALNCLPPTHQPKATEHISHMIEMISELIEKDFAYESDGHVFFDVSKYEDYGKLSGNTLEALRGGDRVGEGEVARKRNAADFVLWKPELDGVGWDAPFGKGRPGWHIECSAMAKATLCDDDYGNTIDIHCGGVDLKFPHHENEKAQSCCANSTEKFANFWVHNEFLNMGSEKMSKSLGNVTLVNDLLKDWDGEVIRWAFFYSKYRNELNWNSNDLVSSKKILDRFYRMKQEYLVGYEIQSVEIIPEFIESILNDLNTPDAFRSVMELMSEKIEMKIASSSYEKDVYAFASIIKSFNLLGLLQKDPEAWFKGGASEDEEAQFNAIAKRREEARAQKDWPAADAARDEAKALGIILEDGPNGTTWRRA